MFSAAYHPFSSAQSGDSPSSQSGANNLEVCIPNISLAERRKRLTAGIVQLVISIAILVVLILAGVNHWWRLPLFVMFWGAAIGYFQWREKT